MKGFLNNIVQRHTNPVNQVMPRLRGTFEQEMVHSRSSGEEHLGKEKIITNPSKPAQNIFDEGTHWNGTHVNSDLPGFKVNSGLEDKVPDSDTEEYNNNHIQPIGIEQPLAGKSLEDVKNEDGQYKSNILNEYYTEKTENSGYPVEPVSKGSIPEKQPSFNEDLPTLSKDIIPVSVKIVTPGFQAGDRSATLNPLGSLNQNKLSQETLSWASNVKNLVNIPGVEINSSRPSVVKVNIGRIEVRASTQQAPIRTKPDQRPGMTLDDFLKKKKG